MTSPNDTNEFPPGEGNTPGGEAPEAPLNTGKPAVAAAPGKLLIVVVLAGFFIFIIIHSLMSGDKAPPPPVKHTKEPVATDNTKNQPDFIANTLPAPPPPAVVETPPTVLPAPPPPPPVLPSTPAPEISTNTPTSEALNKRIHSNMLAINGSKPFGLDVAKHNAAVPSTNDPNSAFAQSVSTTKADTVEATRINNLGTTIAQGKLIHAVLESAINSDLPGPIRAITSHDTYAEAGKEILIPKGSRLIGTYNSSLRRGQARVFIIWQRVIRPDGVDIMIDSLGVDALGRSGMTGDVDNKYFEMFSSAILTSSLDIGMAAVGDALFGNQQTTTTSGAAGTTTTQSPTSAAMQEAVQNVGSVGSNIVSNTLNLAPTINIDQGTPIEVFVSRDLIFPPDVTGKTRFVP